MSAAPDRHRRGARRTVGQHRDDRDLMTHRHQVRHRCPCPLHGARSDLETVRAPAHGRVVGSQEMRRRRAHVAWNDAATVPRGWRAGSDRLLVSSGYARATGYGAAASSGGRSSSTWGSDSSDGSSVSSRVSRRPFLSGSTIGHSPSLRIIASSLSSSSSRGNRNARLRPSGYRRTWRCGVSRGTTGRREQAWAAAWASRPGHVNGCCRRRHCPLGRPAVTRFGTVHSCGGVCAMPAARGRA